MNAVENRQCRMELKTPGDTRAKAMDNKAETIFSAAEGLTRTEWERIRELIDRKFDEAASKVKFSKEDATKASELYKVER